MIYFGDKLAHRNISSTSISRAMMNSFLERLFEREKSGHVLVDHPKGSIVVAASFMVHFMVLGIQYSFGIFYDAFLDAFEEDSGITAGVGSLSFFMMMMGGSALGPYCNTIGFRIPAVFGAILISISLLLSSFASNIWVLYCTWGLLLGTGFSLMFLPAVTVISHHFDRNQALATGIAVAGSGVGNAAMAPIAQALIDQLGWRDALRVLSLVSLALMLPSSLTFKYNGQINPAKKIDDGSEHSGSEPSGSSSSSDEEDGPRSLGEEYVEEAEPEFKCHLKEVKAATLIRDPLFLVFYLSTTIAAFGYLVPFTHLFTHAQEEYDAEDSRASLLITVLGTLSTVGRIFFGRVADMPQVNRLSLMQWSVGMIGITTFIVPFLPEFDFLFGYVAIFGLLAGAFIALQPVLLGDIYGKKNLPNAMGCLYSGISVGALFGPMTAGWIRDATGNYDISLMLAGACLAISIPSFEIIKFYDRKYKREREL